MWNWIAGGVLVGVVGVWVAKNRLSSANLERFDTPLEDLISSSKVLVLSKSYCPYCKSTKNLLLNDLKAKDITVLELNWVANGPDIQDKA